MRRADRLFQITQLLSSDKIITAERLAERLSVSVRTIYRDIQDLMLSDVPIISETGTGYRLMPGYRIPPLMFNAEEITALLMGAKIIQASGDRVLAEAAHEAIHKIAKVIPQQLKKELDRDDFHALDFRQNEAEKQRLFQIRKAISKQNILLVNYQDENHQPTVRTIRPLGLFYWGKVWTVVAWCELRDAFRQFRIDRFQSITDTGQVFVAEENKTLKHYLSNYCG